MHPTTHPTMRLPEDSSLARVQRAFAAHLRDPATCPPPADVAPRRMRVYRELVYANVESLLASNFPVLRSVLGDASWHAMVRDFLVRHAAKTPLFPRLALELLAYLDGERARLPEEPPYLRELARYEWLETELRLAEVEPDPTGVALDGDLLAGVPVLSPVVRWLRAEWPVHRVGAAFRPTTPPDQPSCLVVGRDPDLEVRFMEVTATTLRLLEGIAAAPEATGRAHLEQLARESGRDGDLPHFLEAGRRVLEELRARGVLLGAR
ncbi:MAG TPA: putative DNA-binding domain-containing protein [Myxococcota bacterium]|nr:putative DNA-binding domain-containing protein [Myxococcota bacterium]